MKTKRAGPAASTASVISPTSERHRLFARIQHCRHLAVGEGRYRRTLERHVIETAGVAAQGTIQLDADFLAQVVGGDTGLPGARLAVKAEAEAEEEAGRLAEWVGRPLVMEAMVEGHVADRLGHDGIHPGAGELGRCRPDVSANIGVCRAEIGQEAIAERVLDRGIGVALAESEVVQVDCPRAHGEIARAAHFKQAAQWIDLLEHTREVRLDALPTECSRIGAKEERSSIQKPNPVYGVVWMNVARVVIDRRQLDASKPPRSRATSATVSKPSSMRSLAKTIRAVFIGIPHCARHLAPDRRGGSRAAPAGGGTAPAGGLR